ncbi:hypothetical protein QE152_g35313 [Popillia japonica]|uniref:Uncharacterized protein n=1 Tax=Popillia japonica TaxID=7064 RepID=A0AAW1IF87_POPJA
MDDWSYWKTPLTLNELLDESENLDVEEDQDHTPINLVIFPPETANEDHTDEDSGDEELVDLNNLPGSQLRAPAEIIDSNETNENYDSDTDLDEDVPLSVLYGNMFQIPDWIKEKV